MVSRLGQVRNAQTLIRQEGLTHNRIAVVQTQANPGLNRVVLGHIEPDLFEEVVHLTLPDRPLSQGPRKNRRIFEQIEHLVTESVDRGVDALYLCNVDAFYVFFVRVIRERGFAVSINLLEEGLNTYANLAGRVYERDTRADRSDVQAGFRALLGTYTRAFKATWMLLVTLASWALRFDLARVRRWLTGTLFVPERYRYDDVRAFDAAWVCFPEKVHADAATVGEVHRLDFDAAALPAAPALEAIEEGATVFVSQKYLSTREYLGIVLSILSEMGLGRVYFKYHPREDQGEFARVLRMLAPEYPALDVRTPAAIQPIPIEQLLVSGKVARLVGLTSTSLMYATAFFPDVEVVSVAQRFAHEARSPGRAVAKRALSEFARDMEVFVDVSEVRQHEGP